MLADHVNVEHRARIWYVPGSSLRFARCISQLYRTTNTILTMVAPSRTSVLTPKAWGFSAGFFYAFALTQIPISLLLDKLGAKRLMIAFSFVGMAGAGMFSLAHGLGMGLAGRLVLGVGLQSDGAPETAHGMVPAGRLRDGPQACSTRSEPSATSWPPPRWFCWSSRSAGA